MKAQRSLNVKRMLDVYLSCSDDVQAESIWNAFVVMRDSGFISSYDWTRFYDMAHDAWLSRP